MSEVGRAYPELKLPLDKSRYMRLGILALRDQREDEAVNFLGAQDALSDDLLALNHVLSTYRHSDEIQVGESGTLLRFLRFFAWKNNHDKRFIVDGTLVSRSKKITDSPGIVGWSQAELLTLDNETSQWASAKALCGDMERLPEPPFKLGVTYDVIDEWHNPEAQEGIWMPQIDQTIRRQAITFAEIVAGQNPTFEPEQAEDYPFAHVFNYITAEEAALRWPSLYGHESNRITEVSAKLQQAQEGAPVTSSDHRVVQAIAMWAVVEDVDITFAHPEAVTKSWPKFWQMLETVQSTKL